MSALTTDEQLVDLKLHVTHLIYAIDRGYFGDGIGLRESAFVEPLRAYAKPGFAPVEVAA